MSQAIVRVIVRNEAGTLQYLSQAIKRGGKAGGEILWKCGRCLQELLWEPEIGDECACGAVVAAIQRRHE